MLGAEVKDVSADEIKEGIMKPLVALSLSIGILAAIATWLSLTVGLLVWAVFLAWASFYHCGGDVKALKTSIANNLFGGLCGWIAAVLIVVVPTPGLVLRAAIFVGLTVIVLVLAAHLKALSAIPSGFYGYAATFAYLLMTKDALTISALTKPNMQNGFIAVAVAMIIGNLFGIVSAKFSAAMQHAPKPA
jgi:uncharacterized protein DUF1097